MLDVAKFEDSLSSPDTDGGPTAFAPRKFRRQPLPDVQPIEPRSTEDSVLAEQPQPQSTQDTNRSIEDILAERGKTHGDFTDNARVMQALKRIVHAEVGWDKLTDVQREALHMILHKVGRIISGNPNTHDHWDDIAGYAKLVSERIEK